MCVCVCVCVCVCDCESKVCTAGDEGMAFQHTYIRCECEAKLVLADKYVAASRVNRHSGGPHGVVPRKEVTVEVEDLSNSAPVSCEIDRCYGHGAACAPS